jgi:diguanylate cyclase (GGDEF)-like protein/PAS domain S-box-containing protein
MSNRIPRAARVLLAVAGASLAAQFALAVLGSDPWGHLQHALLAVSMFAAGGSTLCVAAARTDRFRLVWGTVGVAQLLYALGDINWHFIQHELATFPTLSDFLWLVYYPLILMAVGLYLANGRSVRPMLWLDGAIMVTVLVGAAFAWFLGEEFRTASSSDTFVAGQVAYPVLDLVFVSFAVVVGYGSRWRLGPGYWAVAGASLLLFMVDLTLFRQLADGTYSPGTILDSGWAANMILISLAAQLPLRTAHEYVPSGSRFNAIFAGAILFALFLLVRGADAPGGVVAVSCAVAAIVLLAARLMFTLAANERLARENEDIVATAGEGIFRADADGAITFVNPAACQMLGYRPDEMLGKDGHALIHHSRNNGTPYPPEECPIRAVVRDGEPRRVRDEVFWRKDGTSFSVDYTAAPMREDGAVVGLVMVFDDVSGQHSLEARLKEQADHDPLSGLLNRPRFMAEVEDRLDYAHRYGRPGALLLVDLDSFKFINESFGHTTGDTLIARVAAVLKDRLRATDAAGRLGGDEFAVLLTETDTERAIAAASSLIASIRGETTPTLSASIGVATFDGSTDLVADDLVVRADLALNDAKQKGPGTVLHDEGSGEDRLAWVEHLRAALKQDRLVVYSQPIVNVETGEMAGEELLARIIDEHGDVIPPAAFLPTAERFGLIGELDRRVVAHAIDLASTGRRVSVNISSRSLGDHRITERLDEASRTGVDPSLITFEITETAAISNMAEARDFAHRTEALGCKLALDDFGTGFSSLGYLKHIPAQVLKIDMEFIRNLAGNSFDQYLVQVIVGIAHRLGQTTIAEGVEDGRTFALLRTFGVDCAQGYYLGRPAPVEKEPPKPAAVRELAETGQPGC